MSAESTFWALKSKTGNPYSKMILLALANYSNHLHQCFPSAKTLAEDTEMSVRSVQKWLKELEKNGFMKIENQYQEKRQTTSLFTLLVPDLGVQNLQGGCAESADTGMQDLQTEPINNNLPNKYKDQFDEFWNEYPRKVGKKKAFAVYNSLMKFNKATHQEIMSGLSVYKSHLSKNSWLNPAHPTTWLGGERWSDDYSQEEKPTQRYKPPVSDYDYENREPEWSRKMREANNAG